MTERRDPMRDAMRSLPLLDRMLAPFAPAAVARRTVSRMRMMQAAIATRAFDGADRGRRGMHWNARGTSANEELYGGLATLRARSRDLVRNNAWANRAVRAITTRVIGTGIRARLPPGEVAQTWGWWAGSPACDAEGRNNFYGIQARAMRSVIESGEILVRKVLTSEPRMPLRLQLLEPDFLDETKDGPVPGSDHYQVQGIEFDGRGVRVGYWIFRNHPGDRYARDNWKSDFVPASDILHVFRDERPGQVRGLPWGYSSFLRLRDWDQYVDAELMRKKVASALVGFVHDIAGEAVPPTSSTTDNPPEVQDFEPATWETLPAGKTIEFSHPPVTDGFDEFASAMLREIATAYGITFEMISGDYSKVNFTSGRMGRLEVAAEMATWQQTIAINGICLGVWRWFSEVATLSGTIRTRRPPPPDRWIAPQTEMIDPGREVAARIARVRAGFSTLSDEIMADGEDPDAMLAQHAADDQTLDDLKLTLDTDPRKIAAAAAGTTNAQAAAPTAPDPANA
jgi:lambda family phage portal protein